MDIACVPWGNKQRTERASAIGSVFLINRTGRGASLQGEIENSIFLLFKGKGEYWSEVKTALNNCASQKDYNRLIRKPGSPDPGEKAWISLFQQELSEHPALAENAAYHPTEALIDFCDEKRDELDFPAVFLCRVRHLLSPPEGFPTAPPRER